MKAKTKGIEHPLEETYWEQYSLILGMDEAGRGPLCGPACVAGVVLPRGFSSNEINDSKKLSEKKRNALFDQIRREALWYQIVMVDEKTIDEQNIYRAVQNAMEDIALSLPNEFVLTDAMPLNEGIPHEAVIKGDAKSLSIAAASILAKVSRDRYMKALDLEYPQYGLARHKGYPTRQHLETLSQLPVPPFYRRSFGPVARRLEEIAAAKLMPEDEEPVMADSNDDSE